MAAAMMVFLALVPTFVVLLALGALTLCCVHHKHKAAWRFWWSTGAPTNRFYELLFLPGWDRIVSPSGWMCIGMWDAASPAPSTATYDAACEKLALGMMKTTGADLGSRLRVLDVGCGNGNSSFLFARTYPSMTVVGVNISPDQIASAQRRLEGTDGAGVRGRVSFQVVDATDLAEFEGGSFDVVVALECAFHFESRKAFLKETLRVLKSGGRFACADIVARKGLPLRPPPAILKRLMLANPDCNLENVVTYEAKMKAIGFDGPRVTTITKETFLPFCKYMNKAQKYRGSKNVLKNSPRQGGGDSADPRSMDALKAFELYMVAAKFFMRWSADYILASGGAPPAAASTRT